MAILARTFFLVCLGLQGSVAHGEPHGEAGEPTPEALDAAFTREDSARVAAGFNDEPISDMSADPLGNLAAQADLVFRGTVVSQTYEYDARGTPYTRTTFSITEAMKGEHPSDQVTLVQPGGPARNNDRVMMVSDARYFNVGEEELLFMSLDPGSQMETRRVTVMSRFRIFRDRVYNEDGYGVMVESLPDGSYRLALADRRSVDQRFRRIDIGSHRLDKRFLERGGESRDRGAERAGARVPGVDTDVSRADAVDGVDVDTFSELIGR